MLRNEDEDELREILSETFTSTHYIDDEMKDLFGQSEEVPARPFDSSEHMRSSESSQQSYHREEESIDSHLDLSPSSDEVHEEFHEKVTEKIIAVP